jgi:hypothetical protein
MTQESNEPTGASGGSLAWIRVTERLPVPGSWCWVTNGNVAWISFHEKNAAGGWTNGDCWEDFDREVTAWFPVGDHPPLPSPPTSSK